MTQSEKPGVPLTPSQWQAIYGPRHGFTPKLTAVPAPVLDGAVPPKASVGFKPKLAPVVEADTTPVSPIMVVALMGGVGNQLFQYAFGISVAKARDEDVGFTIYRCVDDEWRPAGYQLDAFVDDIKLLPKNKENHPIFDDDKFFSFQQAAYTTTSNTFLGYWQTEKYFDAALIRQKIAFRYPLSNESSRVAEAIIKAGRASTFLHVRQGADYKRNSFHGLLSANYYKEAIQRIKENRPDVQFFVFGDNPNWAYENFSGREFIIVDHNKPDTNSTHEDMHLMSLCRNGVIANSSFSWWAAWLGDTQLDRLIFAPKCWFGDEALLTKETKDVVPDRWIKLETR
jgi:hypothetical protein